LTSADRGITTDLKDKKGTSQDRLKSVRGFFFARTLDKHFLKEMEHETGTSTFEDYSSADQGLGWFSGSHAKNHGRF
jgi:hypothetical protein